MSISSVKTNEKWIVERGLENSLYELDWNTEVTNVSTPTHAKLVIYEKDTLVSLLSIDQSSGFDEENNKWVLSTSDSQSIPDPLLPTTPTDIMYQVSISDDGSSYWPVARGRVHLRNDPATNPGSGSVPNTSPYVQSADLISTSAGSGDAGKPVKLNSSGLLDSSLTGLGNKLHVVNGTASQPAFIAQAAAGQSDNIVEIQDSGGTNLFSIGASGAVSFINPEVNGITRVNVNNDAQSWQLQTNGGSGDKFFIRDATNAFNAVSVTPVTGDVTLAGPLTAASVTIGDEIFTSSGTEVAALDDATGMLIARRTRIAPMLAGSDLVYPNVISGSQTTANQYVALRLHTHEGTDRRVTLDIRGTHQSSKSGLRATIAIQYTSSNTVNVTAHQSGGPDTFTVYYDYPGSGEPIIYWSVGSAFNSFTVDAYTSGLSASNVATWTITNVASATATATTSVNVVTRVQTLIAYNGLGVNADPNGVSEARIANSDATQPALRIDAAAGQTANIAEWRDGSGNLQAYVDSNGVLVGAKSGTTGATRIGSSAGRVATGEYWTALGHAAAYNNTTGSTWNAVGYRAGYSNTTGSYWNAVGFEAGYSNTTGNNWNAVGFQAGFSNTTGNNWNAIGLQAGYSNTTGSNWNAVGYQAGRYIADGTTAATTNTQFTLIGAHTKFLADGSSNEIVIGYNAIGNGSNTVTLGNSSITHTHLGAGVLVIPTGSAPASAAATGARGSIAWDSAYVYVCTAPNTWKRAAISTW